MSKSCAQRFRRGPAARLAAGLLAGLLLALLALAPAAAEQSRRMAVAIIGDSLLTNLDVDPPVARFDKQLWLELDYHGIRSVVDNYSVNGITSEGQLTQLDRISATRPDVVIIAVGLNDAMRGVPVPEVVANLEKMIGRFEHLGAQIVLTTGMQRPRNPGQSESYKDDFERAFQDLAIRHDLVYFPELLTDLLGHRNSHKRTDGIHPNAEGVRQIVRRLMPAVLEAAEKAGLESEL